MVEDNFKNQFAERLNFYMDKRGITQVDIIRDLKLTRSAVSSWCNGTRTPRMDKVDLLVNYLNITRSDLLEEEKNIIKEDSANYYINEDARMLLQDYNNRSDLKVLFDASRKLTVKDVQFIIDMVERMKD